MKYYGAIFNLCIPNKSVQLSKQMNDIIYEELMCAFICVYMCILCAYSVYFNN